MSALAEDEEGNWTVIRYGELQMEQTENPVHQIAS